MQLIGSEIIATRIVNGDARWQTMDRRHVEAPYHELCWQSQTELKMHRKWPQADSEHLMVTKYPAYTKYFPLWPKFCSALLYGQSFSRCRTFYTSSLTTVLNRPKKKKKNEKNLPKVQNFKFHYSFNNFGYRVLWVLIPHPYEYTWILGSKSGVLSGEMLLKLSLPYGPMLMK